MYINAVISVYDDGNTNPMINTHVVTTNDQEATDKFAELIANAVEEGWQKANTYDSVQVNFVKGAPRRTLTIRRDCSQFNFTFNARK